MDDQSPISALRRLPPIHALMALPEAQLLTAEQGRAAVTDAVRETLARLRQSLQGGGVKQEFCRSAFFGRIQADFQARERARLQRVINATGIVIHTNMGRAPLAAEAVEAVRQVASGYSNLEMDLATGKRGGRGGWTHEWLCRLTGAEAALVVNNNAAALLLALGALARGGDVVISRGELVEIGGGFRIPDVITQSGARLVEVGATNKTRLSDYADALTPDTRLFLKVHASNYRMVGFTAEANVAELAALSRARGVTLMHDLGSGALVDLTAFGLPHEPSVAESIRDGADIVAFSGDKLLGGPQCGILVGKADLIGLLATHPLFRALRADKMTLAALEATLKLYGDPERLSESLPVLAMMTATPAVLLRRARRLRAALSKIPDLRVTLKPGVSFSGGGTLPELGLPSQHVHVRSSLTTVESLAASLRRRPLPVVGMIADGAFVLDVRTVRDAEIAEIARAFREIYPELESHL